MSEELTREEVYAAADALVEEVLEASHFSEPPVDALALARHLGIEVRFSQRRGRARVEIPPHELSDEQRQAFAAQELGEHFQGELLDRLGMSAGGPLRGESFTGLLAARLLVPTAWLLAEGRACGYDLAELGERFSTAGHERIAFRLLDLDTPCTITLVENDAVTKRRSNAYRIGKELLPPETACLRQIQRYSRPCRVSDEGWDVRGWPLHEPDRKREILRSVYEE